eukprot:gene12798-17263_t
MKEKETKAEPKKARAAVKKVPKKVPAKKAAAKKKIAKTKVLKPSTVKKIATKKATAPVKDAKKYSFFDDVWDVVRQIPKGRVTNYGAIAKYLGSGLSSRMVGWAMNASHSQALPVPAHRVVNRNGDLT